MSDIFNRIASSSPINKTAARQTSKGEHYQSKKIIQQRHWGAPPSMRQAMPFDFADHQFENLSAKKFGLMTVLGIFNPGGENDRSHRLWIVRCVCGDYETRRRRAILNPSNNADCCDNCRELAYLRRHETEKARGHVKATTVDAFLSRQSVARP